ncbi:MAG: archease [Thermosipho sp. (in: Bacteria)]|nr:archease [Thermosipho sp. (in: thermotogales)]
MYKEINHTADVAYEITAKDFEDLLKNILNIIKENYLPKNINCNTKHVQTYNISENDDGLFDIVNDWISSIDLGYFPISVKKDKNTYITEFCSYQGLNGEKFKALTYHELNIKYKNGYLFTKVVFDV